MSALTPFAYAGAATSQYNLAVIYYRGDDSELNQKQFKFWLQKAANLSDRKVIQRIKKLLQDGLSHPLALYGLSLEILVEHLGMAESKFGYLPNF